MLPVLLIVIAILAVLAAILIPSFSGAQKRPYDVAALQCGRAIITAETARKAETGGFFSGDVNALGSDVQEVCQDIEVQSYVNGFRPGSAVAGNNQIGGDDTQYNFWVYSRKGSTSYYTSSGDRLKLQRQAGTF